MDQSDCEDGSLKLPQSINWVIGYSYTGDFSQFRMRIITKTRLYNFDPLKPLFYIVKLGFTGVYIIFLILLKNIDCGYSLEPPQSMF